MRISLKPNNEEKTIVYVNTLSSYVYPKTQWFDRPYLLPAQRSGVVRDKILLSIRQDEQDKQ